MDSFLKAYTILIKFTRIFGFNNFSVPEKRTSHAKLEMKLFDVFMLVVKVAIFVVILTINGLVSNETAKIDEGLSLTSFVTVLLRYISISMFVTNLIAEFMFHSNLWFVISGFCEFDVMVL